jgi:S1-C subfamily serine protease
MPSEEPEDEGTAGPPPHPLDRPWVHPSELFARSASGRGAPRGAAGSRSGSRGRDLALALGAGIVGALAMVAILGAAGLLGRSNETAPNTSTGPNDTDAAEKIAAVAGHSVVGVVATTPLGKRRASGVVIAPGNVLTTTAVLGGASALDVVTTDGSTRKAKVAGEDDTTGLVVLDVDSHGLDPASLATESTVRSGTWIVAIGGGSGAGPYVTSGVVSSLGGWADDGSGERKPGLIATNTAMPAEARGGALLDSDGRLIGLLMGSQRGGTGALATPAAMARSVVDQLADSGQVEHGELGIRAVDTDSDSGVAVNAVVKGGPAAKSKLEAGDVITSINDEHVADSAALVYEIRRRRAGEQVTLTITRDHQRHDVAVVLGRYVATPTTGTNATTASVATG